MPLDDALCAQIRALYFVARRPVAAIAESLGLDPRAIRAALVLAGGDGGPVRPAPVAHALAATAAPAAVLGRRVLAALPGPRRRAAGRHR